MNLIADLLSYLLSWYIKIRDRDNDKRDFTSSENIQYHLVRSNHSNEDDSLIFCLALVEDDLEANSSSLDEVARYGSKSPYYMEE